MPLLAHILIYPVKSLDPAEVTEATILPSGALEHDRRWAIYDATEKWVNGKRTPRIQQIRSVIDPAARTIALKAAEKGEAAFHFDKDRAALEKWLSEFLGLAVHLDENSQTGFPDDSEAPGPTVISKATLEEVASWYPGLSLEEIRLRFRANLELEGDEPFWEDRLYGEEGQTVPFRVGAVELSGTNPCQRCVVPTRSPTTGERTTEFGRIFEDRRYETLPFWATRSRFDHFYRLAVNTRPVAGKTGRIRVGDMVELL